MTTSHTTEEIRALAMRGILTPAEFDAAMNAATRAAKAAK